MIDKVINQHWSDDILWMVAGINVRSELEEHGIIYDEISNESPNQYGYQWISIVVHDEESKTLLKLMS